MPVVGFVNGGSADSSAGNATAFSKGLGETGYVDLVNSIVSGALSATGGSSGGCCISLLQAIGAPNERDDNSIPSLLPHRLMR